MSVAIAVDNVAKVKDVITNTVENKAKLGAKREGKGSGSAASTSSTMLTSFVRTSKILFEPNNINQVKQTELSHFIDLCSDALHFYVVYFAKYYELDKLLFVGAKDKNNKIFDPNSNLTKLNNIFYELRYDEKKNRDCFGLKLKFYPDEILEILTNEKNSVAATQAQLNSGGGGIASGGEAAIAKLSARTLKSVKTQAMGIIRSWVQQIRFATKLSIWLFQQRTIQKIT